MRISDWSSDVCSSDLVGLLLVFLNLAPGVGTTGGASHRGYGLAGATTDLIAKQTTDHRTNGGTGDLVRVLRLHLILHHLVLAHFARTGTRFSDGLGVEYLAGDIDGARKRGVWGKSVSVRVDL